MSIFAKWFTRKNSPAYVTVSVPADGRVFIVMKNGRPSVFKDAERYSLTDAVAARKLRKDMEIMRKALVELQIRMRVIDGEASEARLDIPILELIQGGNS